MNDMRLMTRGSGKSPEQHSALVCPLSVPVLLSQVEMSKHNASEGV